MFEMKKVILLKCFLLRFHRFGIYNKVYKINISLQGPQGEPGPPGQQGNPGAQVSR